MEEKQNWLTIAAVVLVVAGLGVFLYRQSQQEPTDIGANQQDTAEQDRERADEVLRDMNVELPEGTERVDLRDVSESGAAGVATRTEEGETVTQSLLVSLPEPEAGNFYEGYLVNSESEEAEPMYLGKLRSVKGGWMLDYQISEGSENYNTVQVTRETTDDQQPETVLLEGSFNQE